MLMYETWIELFFFSVRTSSSASSPACSVTDADAKLSPTLVAVADEKMMTNEEQQDDATTDETKLLKNEDAAEVKEMMRLSNGPHH